MPNLNGVGSMLIAALEGYSPDVYDIPLDGSQPTIELHTANYLATQLGTWVGYGIAAYNNMIVYPQSGSTSCPDLLIGLSVVRDAICKCIREFLSHPVIPHTPLQWVLRLSDHR